MKKTVLPILVFSLFITIHSFAAGLETFSVEEYDFVSSDDIQSRLNLMGPAIHAYAYHGQSGEVNLSSKRKDSFWNIIYSFSIFEDQYDYVNEIENENDIFVYSKKELEDVSYILFSDFDGIIPEFPLDNHLWKIIDEEYYMTPATPEQQEFELLSYRENEDKSIDAAYALKYFVVDPEGDSGYSEFSRHYVHLVPNEKVNESSAHPLYYRISAMSNEKNEDDRSKTAVADEEIISFNNTETIGDENYLVNYIGASYDSATEVFGEPERSFDAITGKGSWNYKETGVEFLISEGFGPETFNTVVCHNTHYPIIGGLYGDSTLKEYLTYFENNGYIKEPETIAYSVKDNDLRYIDSTLRYLFRLENGPENEPPASVTISQIMPTIYSETWQTYFVQQILTWLGYDPGPTDSVMGQKTAAAVSAFQEDHWLEATGIIDSNLVSGLSHLWNKKCKYGEEEPWYSAYETQLVLWSTTEVPDTDAYALIYIDKDEIPELELMGRFGAQGSWTLTWHDGVMDAKRMAVTSLMYRHKKNIAIDNYAHMGYYLDYVYRIKDGKFQQVAKGEFRQDNDATRIEMLKNKNSNGVFIYSWDGTEVSEGDYYRNLIKFIPKGKVRQPSVTYDYMGIMSALWAGGAKEIDKGKTVEVSRYMDIDEKYRVDAETVESEKTPIDKMDLFSFLGMTITEAGNYINMDMLEKRSERFYLFTEEIDDLRSRGFNFTVDLNENILSIGLDALKGYFTILGIYPGITVKEAIEILYRNGFHFENAGSTKGVLTVWAGYASPSTKIYIVSSQQAAHGSVTEESQLQLDATIDSVSISKISQDAVEEQNGETNHFDEVPQIETLDRMVRLDSIEKCNVTINDIPFEFDDFCYSEGYRKVLLNTSDIGKLFNLNVYYSEGYEAVLIDANGTGILLNKDWGYVYKLKDEFRDNWKRVPLSVPLKLTEAGLYIPLEDFCNLLGCLYTEDVESASCTVTEYLQINDRLSPRIVSNIGTALHILLQDEGLPYGDAIKDIIDFYDGRNPNSDAFGIGLSNVYQTSALLFEESLNAYKILLEAVHPVLQAFDYSSIVTDVVISLSNLWNLDGKMTDKIAKESLEAVLSAISNVELDEFQNNIREDTEQGTQTLGIVNDTVSTLTDIPKTMENLYPNSVLTELFNDSHVFKKISDFWSDSNIDSFIEAGLFTFNEIVSLSTMYIGTLDYIQVLRDSIDSGDTIVLRALDEIQNEYEDRFGKALKDTRDWLPQFMLSCYGGPVKFLFDVGMEITGFKSANDALRKFYGLFVINTELRSSYSRYAMKVVNSDYDRDDIEILRKMDAIQRAVYCCAYNAMQKTGKNTEKAYYKERMEAYSEPFAFWKSDNERQTDYYDRYVSKTDVSGAKTGKETEESESAKGHLYMADAAHWLEPLRVAASSTLEGGNYKAENVTDFDMRTAWVEGVDGHGQGEYIDLFFEPQTAIIGGMITPGYYQDEETFWRNSAPVSITVMSNGVEVPVDVSPLATSYMSDQFGYRFMLSTPLICDADHGTLRVTIRDVRGGSVYSDTCISELHFLGFPDSQYALDVDEDLIRNQVPYDPEDETLASLKTIAYLIQRTLAMDAGAFGDHHIPDLSVSRDTLPPSAKSMIMFWYQWFMKNDERIIRDGSGYNSARLTDLKDIQHELFMDDSDLTWNTFRDEWVNVEEGGIGMMYSSADFGGWYGLADPFMVTVNGEIMVMYGCVERWEADIRPIVLDKKYTAVFTKGQGNRFGDWVFQSLDIGPDFIQPE